MDVNRSGRIFFKKLVDIDWKAWVARRQTNEIGSVEWKRIRNWIKRERSVPYIEVAQARKGSIRDGSSCLRGKTPPHLVEKVEDHGDVAARV